MDIVITLLDKFKDALSDYELHQFMTRAQKSFSEIDEAGRSLDNFVKVTFGGRFSNQKIFTFYRAGDVKGVNVSTTKYFFMEYTSNAGYITMIKCDILSQSEYAEQFYKLQQKFPF